MRDCILQAHFVRVCELLDHTSGAWKVTVMIGDDRGCNLRVHLSDKVGHAYVQSIDTVSLLHNTCLSL